MSYIVTEAARAEWASWPDERFPDFVSAGRSLLGELPRCGNGLAVLCAGCCTERWLAGREICRRWPDWLHRPQIEWARALRCQDCGARRFRLHALGDPAASGFQLGPEETAPIVACRRLAAWLEGTGVTLDELAPHLSHMPIAADRRLHGF